MRFLHTADLHLGKQMNDLSLLQDQEYILRQIVSIAERERADAVLIAGDIYQRSAPQAEAVALFDRFVCDLAGLGIKVIAISGNHDSALRVSYFAPLVRSSGIYLSEAFEGRLQAVRLEDAHGEVFVWLLPFLRPSQVKRALPEETIRSCQDAVAAVLRQTPVDTGKRNILLCHQFVTGCETCDSEELAVGGLDNVDVSVFGDFDYVALGHIHKPQSVVRKTLRYAGSPLKYSFSEAAHKKSVSIIDMGEKGETDVRTVPLVPLHEVRIIDGMLEDLMRGPYSEDYLWVTVHDELPPPDARVELSVMYPNMLKFSVVNSRTKADLDVTASERMENKTVLELFEDFYRLQNNDQKPGEAHQRVMEKALTELEERA